MIDAWFFPAWNGDFRLVAAGDDTCELVVTDPTPHERDVLGRFLAQAKKKKWTAAELGDDRQQTISIAAPVEDVGPVLVKLAKPADRTLTAVKFEDGKLEIAETGAIETIAAEAKKGRRRSKAASVARPTPCCPECVPGSVDMASEVLLSFLTPEEHADWARHRAIMVRGGLSGHRYLIAHRHSDTAVKLGKICYDVDDRCVLHFHDWTVPGEEEVLAAKLILEHREPWLRNEATVLQPTKDGRWVDLGFLRYKNPFGDASDGRPDAGLTAAFGVAAMHLVRGMP